MAPQREIDPPEPSTGADEHRDIGNASQPARRTMGAGESPRPDEELGASESMAAAFCALFEPGDGGVVMQPCAGSVLAAELSLG